MGSRGHAGNVICLPSMGGCTLQRSDCIDTPLLPSLHSPVLFSSFPSFCEAFWCSPLQLVLIGKQFYVFLPTASTSRFVFVDESVDRVSYPINKFRLAPNLLSKEEADLGLLILLTSPSH